MLNGKYTLSLICICFFEIGAHSYTGYVCSRPADLGIIGGKKHCYLELRSEEQETNFSHNTHDSVYNEYIDSTRDYLVDTASYPNNKSGSKGCMNEDPEKLKRIRSEIQCWVFQEEMSGDDWCNLSCGGLKRYHASALTTKFLRINLF